MKKTIVPLFFAALSLVALIAGGGSASAAPYGPQFVLLVSPDFGTTEERAVLTAYSTTSRFSDVAPVIATYTANTDEEPSYRLRMRGRSLFRPRDLDIPEESILTARINQAPLLLLEGHGHSGPDSDPSGTLDFILTLFDPENMDAPRAQVSIHIRDRSAIEESLAHEIRWHIANTFGRAFLIRGAIWRCEKMLVEKSSPLNKM